MHILHPRAPDKKFMLQSIKNVYTFNFAMALCTFCILKLLCLFFKSCRNSCTLSGQIYKLLRRNSFWWTLISGLIEPNIAPITFYSSVQLNLFFCFDFVSKLNLYFTITIFYIVICFTFMFYPVICSNGYHNHKRRLYQFSNPKNNNFLLEMTLKFIHTFLHSLTHGLLINHNKLQLIFLLSLDIVLIIILIKYRRQFVYKIVFVLFLVYFVTFTSFDSILIYYVFAD